MFQRFHSMKERREDGFTLIELLVVILIVAILAAVAIPVFLRQREKGYVDQMESALKNMATSAESHATEENGSYALLVGTGCDDAGVCDAEVTDQGFSPTQDVAITFVTADDQGYCIEATHSNLDPPDDVMHYDSAVGAPEDLGC